MPTGAALEELNGRGRDEQRQALAIYLCGLYQAPRHHSVSEPGLRCPTRRL